MPIVLALDVKDRRRLERPCSQRMAGPRTAACRSGNASILSAMRGHQHVLCTDVARDGAMSGPNFKLYAEILQRYPRLQLQASGGVRDIDDLEMLRELGLPAAITGRALLDGEIT